MRDPLSANLSGAAAAVGPAALGQAGSRHSINIGATSTDANAAHAAGVPAVALGVTRGQGEHTPGEWIETGQVGTGLAVLADTITTFREAPL